MNDSPLMIMNQALWEELSGRRASDLPFDCRICFDLQEPHSGHAGYCVACIEENDGG